MWEMLAAVALAATPERSPPSAPSPATPSRLDARAAIAELAVGRGAPVATGTTVAVEISVFDPDGALVDSTLSRARPERMLLGSPRTGDRWTEAVVGMRLGGRRQVVWYDEAGAVAQILELALVDAWTPPTPEPLAGPVHQVEIVDWTLGGGEAVSAGRRIALDYALFLADGTPVDSSWSWPEPFAYVWGAGRVRWEDALAGMRAGGRRQIALPSAHGWGPEGRPPAVPPAADLVLVVDLWTVE